MNRQNKETFFAHEIVAWYETNKRILPWRGITNPYLIWLSEIILQQTRVEQGREYYHAFAENFPDVQSLAKAKEDKVLKCWQGLGYYSRARNLHATAKQIVKNYGGNFPASYNELLKLKGIGPYTAAAIASLAFGLPHAVVDGNVYRILSRYFGIQTPIDSAKGKEEFSKLANRLLKKQNPGIFNQAMMEFGAIQCKPANPDCAVCPFQASCFAFSKSSITKLPVKEKKTQVRNRWFYYLVLNYTNSVYLKKRTEKDIWKGLFDFPLLETKEKVSEKNLFALPEFQKTIGKKKYTVRSVSKEFRHVLSHQKLHARFIEIEIYSPLSTKKLKCVNCNDIDKYAVPRLIEKYWNRKLETGNNEASAELINSYNQSVFHSINK